MRSSFYFGKCVHKIFLTFTVCHINFVFYIKNLNANKYFKINDICEVLERCHLAVAVDLLGK